MADATRRDIVRQVLNAEQSISDLAHRYPMSMTAVLKHVAVQADAGLVVKHRRGRVQRVLGRVEALHGALRLLDTYEEVWRDRLARIDDLQADTNEGEHE